MTRTEKLNIWVNKLSDDSLKFLLVECIEELIDNETINLSSDTNEPYWSGNGERLDGSNPID